MKVIAVCRDDIVRLKYNPHTTDDGKALCMRALGERVHLPLRCEFNRREALWRVSRWLCGASFIAKPKDYEVIMVDACITPLRQYQ